MLYICAPINPKNKKMKKHLLIISALFLSAAVNAQVWTSQATGFATASRGIRNVSAVDANNVWVSTYDGSGGAANSQDYSRTTDGGTTWTPGMITTPATFNWSNIWAISATTAWACFYDASGATGGGIFKTSDGGATWAQQGVGSIYNNTGSFADIVYFWDANNGVTIGDPAGPGTSFYEIYTTTDGGTTWTRTPTANIPGKLSASEYGIVNLYSANGNTIWFGTNQGRMYKSTDKGLTWTVAVVSTLNTDQVVDVAFRTATEGIAVVVDAGGTIFSQYSTTDGGTTWTAFTPTAGTFFQTGDLAVIPNSTAYVSTGANPLTALGSSYSTDMGATWTLIDTATQYTAMGWVDGLTGWAGGFNVDATNGGIYKYTGTALSVNALNNDNAKMSMYPNPSNGQFTLQIAGAESKDAVVKIVDVTGSVAYENSISNSSDIIIKKVDLSNVSKGIYFVTVENGTTRFVNKIVIQ